MVSLPNKIDLPWPRIQLISDRKYSSLTEFFNSMIAEYKDRIDNKLAKSIHVLVTYRETNDRDHEYQYIEAVDLFPVAKITVYGSI